MGAIASQRQVLTHHFALVCEDRPVGKSHQLSVESRNHAYRKRHQYSACVKILAIKSRCAERSLESPSPDGRLFGSFSVVQMFLSAVLSVQI